MAVVGVFGGGVRFELGTQQPLCQHTPIALSRFAVDEQTKTLFETEMVKIKRGLFCQGPCHVGADPILPHLHRADPNLMQVQAGLVVGGAANILMLWQLKYALVGRLYLLVQAMLQNRLHSLPAHGVVLERAYACRLQTQASELLPKTQHAEATAERLLRVAALLQQSLNQHLCTRPYRGRLAAQGSCRYASDCPVRRRHVRFDRCVPSLEGAVKMAGQARPAMEHLHRRGGRAHVHLLAGVLARHRVVVAADLDVVVDADPRQLPLGVLVGLLGHGRSAGWSISAKALARQPGSFLNGRTFRSASSSRSTRLSSLMLKKRWWRKRARTQRSTTSTPFSTLALSLGCAPAPAAPRPRSGSPDPSRCS